MPRYFFGHHTDAITEHVVKLEQRNVKVRLPMFEPTRNRDGIYNTAFKMKSNALYNEIKARLEEKADGRYTVTEHLNNKLTTPLRLNQKRNAQAYKISNNDYKYLAIEVNKVYSNVTISIVIFIHFFCHKFYKDDATVSVVVTTADCRNKKDRFNNYAPGCEFENSRYFFRSTEADTGIDIGSVISIITTYYDSIDTLEVSHAKDLKKNKLALMRVYSIIDQMAKKFTGDPTQETSPDMLLTYYGIQYKKKYEGYDYGIIVKSNVEDNIATNVDITVWYNNSSRHASHSVMLFRIPITEFNITAVSEAVDTIARAVENMVKIMC